MDTDGGETGQGGLEASINPRRKDFGGGIFEAVDFVEIIVIEDLVQGLPGGGDLGKIDDHTALRVDGAGHDDVDLVAVAVKPAAFVPFGDVWEAVGRLETKCFGQRGGRHQRSL